MYQSSIFFKSFKIFLTRTLIVVSIFASVLYAGVKVYAVYYPTDNITNPACAPGSVGCYVSLLPDQTSNAGKFLITNGVNPSWGSGFALENTQVEGVSSFVVSGGNKSYFGASPTSANALLSGVFIKANILGEDGNTGLTMVRSQNNGSGPYVYMVKTRGTLASPTDYISGDTVGAVTSNAYYNGGIRTATSIYSIARGNVGNFVMGEINFLVQTATNNETLMSIQGSSGSGNVVIGSAASAVTPLGRLHLKGVTSDNTANALYIENSSATNLFTVKNDGKVGIGTATIAAQSGQSSTAPIFKVNGMSNTILATSYSGSGSTVASYLETDEAGTATGVETANTGNIGLQVVTNAGSTGDYGGVTIKVGSTASTGGISTGLVSRVVSTGAGSNIGTISFARQSGSIVNAIGGYFATTSGSALTRANLLSPSIGGLASAIVADSVGAVGGNIFEGRNDTNLRFVIQAGGNVGIGAANPSANLEIQPSTGTGEVWQWIKNSRDATSRATLYVENNIGQNINIMQYGSTATGTQFGINKANMSVLQTGGVLNGSSPFVIRTGSTLMEIVFGQNDTERMRIDKTTGFVGIANPAPSYTLHVGSSAVTGIVSRFQNSTGTCDINPTTTALSCSSDRNLKTNITNINNNILSNITSLQPVTYNWISDTTGPTQTGFIAQDVEAIFPNLVSTDPNTNLKSLNYIGLIPYTVEGIKELNLKIDGIASLDVSNGNSVGSLVTRFLSDSIKPIKNLFVKEVTVELLCVGTPENKTCISKNQLDALLQMQNVQTQNSNQVIEPVTPIIQNDNPPVVENPDNNSGNSTPDNSGTPAEIPTE